jgi:hypothetical protein
VDAVADVLPDHLQAPRRIGLPKLDVETSLLAPIAPSFVNFHRHTESTAPYTAPSSASSARLLALTEQAQSLTHATLGVFGGAAPGSLDIFWPDPQTLKAKHVASSTSPWSNTQALTGPGAESALVDDLAEPQSRGQGAVATLPNTLTAKERKFEACARFSTVQSSRRPSSTLNARANRAAQAQAEFEREVARGTAARRHAAKLAPAILTFVLESGVSPTDVNARVRASTSGINWREPCGTIRHYTCPLCGRSFDRPSGLHVHGRKHTGHRRTRLLRHAGRRLC